MYYKTKNITTNYPIFSSENLDISCVLLEREYNKNKPIYSPEKEFFSGLLHLIILFDTGNSYSGSGKISGIGVFCIFFSHTGFI